MQTIDGSDGSVEDEECWFRLLEQQKKYKIALDRITFYTIFVMKNKIITFLESPEKDKAEVGRKCALFILFFELK